MMTKPTVRPAACLSFICSCGDRRIIASLAGYLQTLYLEKEDEYV